MNSVWTIAVFSVIGAVAANLISGWIQKDVILNVFSRRRVILSIITAILASAALAYLQSNALPHPVSEADPSTIDASQQAVVQGTLNDNTIIQSGGGDVNVSIAPPPESTVTGSGQAPLLVSAWLVPCAGIPIWFSPKIVQDETAEFPQIPALYPQVSTVEMQIESLEKEQSIRLSKLSLVRLSDHREATIRQVYFGVGMGAWGYDHHFTARLDPGAQGRVLEAARRESYEFPIKEMGDYWVIDPGGVEVVSLWLDFAQPGTYTFDVGLEYVFQTQKRQLWASEPLTIQVPDTYYQVDWMTGEWSKLTFAQLEGQ